MSRRCRAGVARQAALQVVRPPGQLGATPVGLAIVFRHRPEQRQSSARAAPEQRQSSARAAPEQDAARHRADALRQRGRSAAPGPCRPRSGQTTVWSTVVGRGGLDASTLRQLLPPCGGRLPGGGALLGERLPALAVQGVLVTVGRRWSPLVTVGHRWSPLVTGARSPTLSQRQGVRAWAWRVSRSVHQRPASARSAWR